MTCDNIIGVKNILISFTDCDTGAVVRNVSHKLSTEELPEIKTCEWVNTVLTHGYTRRTAANAGMGLSVIRDERVPLAYYQGCAALDIQIEYTNGLVYTGVGGSQTGDTRSDTHTVQLDVSFPTIDEMLPATQLVAA